MDQLDLQGLQELWGLWEKLETEAVRVVKERWEKQGIRDPLERQVLLGLGAKTDLMV
jgi:hypothetical protein